MMKRVLVNSLKVLLERTFPQHFILSRRPCGKMNKVALTFDDGPDAENTPKILEILMGRDIKATFFLTGETVQKYPQLVIQIAQQGHQLANHGFLHKRIKEIGFKEYVYGIEKTHRLLAELNGYRRRFFRPPYGELSMGLMMYALKSKTTITYWTFDSVDSSKRSSWELKRYLESSEIKNGEIILFHEDYRHTVEALPEIIDDLRRRGFSFVKISEL